MKNVLDFLNAELETTILVPGIDKVDASPLQRRTAEVENATAAGS